MSLARSRKGTAAWTRRAWQERLPRTKIASGVQRLPDTTVTEVDAWAWLGGEGRDPLVSAEQRADAFVRANRGLLRDLSVDVDVRRSAGRPVLRVATAHRVGAIPLASPLSGKPDFGLVIEPRFRWSSLGDVLAGTGMRVTPEPLPLPDLPRSERRIPPWVLSSMVLRRMERLLERLSRRFTMTRADLKLPRGRIDWTTYAHRSLAHGRADDVPCTFPDLQEDEALRAAIHHILRIHRDALLSQRTAGIVVRELLTLCEALLVKVAGTAPKAPSGQVMASWQRTPAASKVFREGLQAIEWTAEERGLAGLSDLSGIAWHLDMEVFFEAWVETVVAQLARGIGARVKVGRREQTRVPVVWQPSWAGSQKSMVPDVVLEHEDLTIVFDAKYKAHAEELNLGGWRRADDVLREHHRNDLLQVVAYSSLFDTKRVVACLVYPCQPSTWASLQERDRTLLRAKLPAGQRQVELALAAVPMSHDVSAVAKALVPLLRSPLA